MQVHPIPGFYEPFSAISHLAGALAFALSGIPLLRRAAGSRLRIVLFAVYIFSGVFLLAMSGVYHLLTEGTTGRNMLGRLDHAAIFVLIAGTHTPVQGIFFRGFARWGPLAVMWIAAAAGVTLSSVFYDQMPAGLLTSVYLLLGWFGAGSGLVLLRRLGLRPMSDLLLGGLLYSVGAVLMGLDWPNLLPGVIGPHELWHVMVLCAIGTHWRFLYRSADIPVDGRRPGP